MEIEIGANLRIKEPNAKFKEFLKKNLIVPNKEYITRQRLGLWLGNTPKYVYLYKMDGDDCVVPYGLIETLIEEVPDATLTPTFVDHAKVNFKLKDMGLYDYQKKAVNEMSKHYAGILQSKAGSGKTSMGIALAAKLGKRTLWVAHTKDLIRQAYDRATSFMPKEKCGLTLDGKVEIGECFTFATIQTLMAQNLLDFVDTFDTIIIDECHAVSRNADRLKMYEKLLGTLRARHKFGLSATPKTQDGNWRTTFVIMGSVKHKVPDSAIANRVLQPIICPVKTQFAFPPDCYDTDGMMDMNKIKKYRETNTKRNQLIANIIENQKNHSILILFDTLDHIDRVMELLPEELKPYAAKIHGKMTRKEDRKLRVQYLDEMRSGEKKYLFCTFALAKEGLDIPRLDRLILAAPHVNETVIIQSIGRVSRIYQGKKDAIVFDIIDQNGHFTSTRYRVYKKENCKFKSIEEVWE